MTNTFVYYGLSLNSVAISGNLYLNFMLVCLIEVPAGLVTWLLMERYGRRSSMCSSLVLTGVSCIAFLFIPDTEGKTRRPPQSHQSSKRTPHASAKRPWLSTSFRVLSGAPCS